MSQRNLIILVALILTSILLILRSTLLVDSSADHNNQKSKEEEEEHENHEYESLKPKTKKQPESMQGQQEPTSTEENNNNNEEESHNSGLDCPQMYSSFRCVDNGPGEASLVGAEHELGFNIFNRSCLYINVVFESYTFALYLKKVPKSENTNHNIDILSSDHSIPGPVSLSSRPFDLPHGHGKRVQIKNKMRESHQWRPRIKQGPIPCSYIPSKSKSPEKYETWKNTILAYYSPIVAPWNFAHTLLCDLFGVFWAVHDIFGGKEDRVPKNLQIVAYGKHYGAEFGKDLKVNKAFPMMSRVQPVFENGLKNGQLYGKLIAGIGTKSWSWVTSEYKASGSPQLWYDFRRHIMKTVGLITKTSTNEKDQHVVQSAKTDSKKKQKLHVSICHKVDAGSGKADKRGIVNYQETLSFLQSAAKDGYFFDNEEDKEKFEIDIALENPVGKPADRQVQFMLDADIYICNEGTLSTPLFLMRPGKAYISLPLVYHTPHLHQKNMPDPKVWWKVPDPLRPDPRKNIGGNIDWFPQAIPWVKSFFYDYVPLNETLIHTPLRGLRNYMPDMNIIVQKKRILPLVKNAVKFVVEAAKAQQEDENNKKHTIQNNKILDSIHFDDIPKELLTDRPNYSITADLCRQMLRAAPNMTRSFNTARCLFGMSWLCEFWANTQYKWRFLHGKWSYYHCGGKASSVEYLKLKDPRLERPLKEFLYYTKDELLAMYNDTDFGKKMKTVVGEEETAIYN